MSGCHLNTLTSWSLCLVFYSSRLHNIFLFIKTLTHLAPDVLGSSGLRDGLRTPISLTNSPEATFFTPVVDTGLFDHDGQEKAPSSCLIAKPHYDVDDPRVPDDLSTPTEVKEPPPLHCRSCKADSCEDITATMCGHVFCNS